MPRDHVFAIILVTDLSAYCLATDLFVRVYEENHFDVSSLTAFVTEVLTKPYTIFQGCLSSHNFCLFSATLDQDFDTPVPKCSILLTSSTLL